MLKFILIPLCVFISVSVVAETVYKKIQSDGSVEFTDRKSKDSQEIIIRKPSIYQAPPISIQNLPSKKLSPVLKYSIKILQPTKDAFIINKESVLVSITIQPEIKKGYGHQIRYQLAGKSITSLSSSVLFKNIPRGTHTLDVSVINEKDEVLGPVASVTFHVKRFFKKSTPPSPPPKAPQK